MQWRKVDGTMKSLAKTKGLSTEATSGLHEGVLISTLVYGCETLLSYEYKKSPVRAVEMYRLRNVRRIC